jgi:SAM-dependent methyltransferase
MEVEKYNIYDGFLRWARGRYFGRIVSKYTSNSDLILDIGSGQGDFLDECVSANRTGIGLDVDSRWVAVCADRGLPILQASSDALPFKGNSADVIFTHSHIEHVPHEGAMKEFFRVIKPGGLLILSAPTPAASFWDDPTHIRPYTPKSLMLLLQMFGFDMLKCNYVWSEMIGLNVNWSGIYKIMNILPFTLGSNVVCFGRKKTEA